MQVTDLTWSLGKIDPTTGRAVPQAGDPDVLLATTFGRGQFAIRLAPIVFPARSQLDTKLPAPDGSISGTDAQGNPIVKVAQPVIDGLSEQTAFGNTVWITLLDLTDPSNPRIIGGYDPSNPATDVAANQTDASGNFPVQVNPAGFATNGIKTIGIQATDPSGTSGNIQKITIDLQATSLGLAPAAHDPDPGAQPVRRLVEPVASRRAGPERHQHQHGASDRDDRSQRHRVPLPGGQRHRQRVRGGHARRATPAATSASRSAPWPTVTYTYLVQATNSFGTTNSGQLTFTIKTQGRPSCRP